MATLVGRNWLVGLCAFVWLGASGCQQNSTGSAATGSAAPSPAAAVSAASGGETAAAATPAEDGKTTASPAAADTRAAHDSDATRTDETDAPTPATVAAEPVVPATPVAPAAPAADESRPSTTLNIGDAAPPLAVSQWFTGQPLTALEPGKVHVVEFWATWCGPCRASMPHISQLQQQYGDDVRFIGVTREPPDVVEAFLAGKHESGKSWRELITYRLVQDDDARMNAAYMQAAGQNGIPCAFVVGTDGAVEWIGHPMSIDAPLAKIVSGQWDRAAAIAELKDRQRQRELQARLAGLLRANKIDEALAALDELTAGTGPSLSTARLRYMILLQAGRDSEAQAVEAQLVELAWELPQVLNEIAWRIATADGESRNLALALRAAERASELEKHEDAAILDTLARVHFEQGNLASALEWQRKAVQRAPGNAELAATLQQYEDQAAKAAAGNAPPSTPAPDADGSATDPANP